MTELAFESALEAIRAQEKKYGVSIDFTRDSVWDKDHLNCLWYGGDIGAICFPDGWKLVIGVYGEVRVYGKIGGQEIDFKDKRNGGRAYQELALAYGIDDERLYHLENSPMVDGEYIEFENNNWVEIDAITPKGNFVDLCSCDNLLDDDVLDAFVDIEYALGYLDCAKEIAGDEGIN